MQISIPLSGQTIHTKMRHLGYAPEGTDEHTHEMKFHRALGGGRGAYPKFHAYCKLSDDKKTASINLHLDQKAPLYTGARAHAAEYEGELVETEIARIRALSIS